MQNITSGNFGQQQTIMYQAVSDWAVLLAAAAADKHLSHLNVKDERNYLGHEVGVGQRKFQVQRFSADGEKRVFLVSGGRVDPVELVGQGEQLELLQREVELPSVGHEVEQVRVRTNGPETKNSKTSIRISKVHREGIAQR